MRSKLMLKWVPRTPLCWWCNRAFYGYRCAVVWSQGHVREVHATCASSVEASELARDTIGGDK